MIELITDLPDDVLGFSATGEVTEQDYQNILLPAVEQQLKRRGKVRLLYHLGSDVTGFEKSALWDDAKWGLKHLQAWEKVAVVSDLEIIRWGMKFFALMIPGHVKVFSNADFAKAKRWICS